jgi:acetate kinase
VLETTSRQDWTGWIEAHVREAGAAAVGHRVVHGGTRRGPLRLDDMAVDELEVFRRLAPLHNGPALELIASSRETLSSTPQYACFDTDFHAGLAPAATTYPLPFAWFEEWGVRRFGFHGLSVDWATERTAALLSRPITQLNVVVAHLGSGCSVTAVHRGSSADTSMGMTPLEGLMMGTRSGSIDPGILLHVLESGATSLSELGDTLQHHSGLLGVSGVSADLRAVKKAATGNERAALAIELFVRRAAAGIASAATAVPTLDAVTFTGGIGAYDSEMMGAICERLTTIGIPEGVQAIGEADAVVSSPAAGVAVLRVVAREDLVIARQVAHALALLAL